MYYPTENGVEKRIESWKIFIPMQDNRQKPFPEEIINSIKSKIITEFGGLTSINIVGYWDSGEQIYVDRGITIIVDVPAEDHNLSSSFLVRQGDVRLCEKYNI